MKVTINNRIGRSAKEYLEKYKTRFPEFKITTEKTYNGIVIEIDDDDYEDFVDAIEAGGFSFDSDEAPEPVKQKPVFPKAKPKLDKVKPKLPRFLK